MNSIQHNAPSPIKIAWRNIEGSALKSWVVGVCAGVLAGFVIGTTLILGGARDSLDLALQRLGADILVVPAGAEDKVENAFLMGAPATMWMPRAVLDDIVSTPGVQVVSPQLFLVTLRGASCCSVPEMFLIAYEPETDFTLRPWLERNMKEGLALGQAVGGSFVYLPQGEDVIKIYGYGIDLKGNLSQTGTGLDQSMFFTFETAYEISRLSPVQAERPLVIEPDSISAALIQVEPGANANDVARDLERRIAGVTAIPSTRLFASQREQITALFGSIAVLLGLVWLLGVALTTVVFSIAANERRREMGVLRALGAPRRAVLQSLLTEAVLLSLAGGLTGVGVAASGIWIFRNLIVKMMRAPFLFPGPFPLLVLSAEALALALASVILAALLPALRISLQDPAIAMRE